MSSKSLLTLIFLSRTVFSEESSICNLPKRVGKCRALTWRVFYNLETKSCEEFGFGGCDGNDNNFYTAEECVRACYKLSTEEEILSASQSIPRPGYDKMVNMLKPKPLQAAKIDVRNINIFSSDEKSNENPQDILQDTIEDLIVLNWIVFVILVVGISSFMVYYLKLRKKKINDDDYNPLNTDSQ